MKKTKLIVHIGQGKTGSTAIQHTLRERSDELKNQGIHYLGHMLEHAGADVPKHWQDVGGIQRLLYDMADEDVTDEVFGVLSAALERLNDAGIHTAIWSNEALFQRSRGVGPALAKLRDAGWSVDIIVYLRRHDKWAQSAYAQWGIKHKFYDGPALSFRDWLKLRPVHFAGELEYWHKTHGAFLTPVNFDEIDDVVADFSLRIGAKVMSAERIYETPTNDILAAWAVHNSRFENETLPGSYMRILNAVNLLHQPVANVPEPEKLFPNDDDLQHVLTVAEGDIERVNAILRENGVSEFTDKTGVKAKAPPSEWDMIKMLITMTSSQQEQIIRLRKRIEDLER